MWDHSCLEIPVFGICTLRGRRGVAWWDSPHLLCRVKLCMLVKFRSVAPFFFLAKVLFLTSFFYFYFFFKTERGVVI